MSRGLPSMTALLGLLAIAAVTGGRAVEEGGMALRLPGLAENGAQVPLDSTANLAAVSCAVDINGTEVAQATGDAVMGDPYASLAWLANKLAEYGRGLEAGQYVMSGSFTREFPLKAGDEACTRFSGIGAVAVRVR